MPLVAVQRLNGRLTVKCTARVGEGNLEGGRLQIYSELREESGDVEVSAMKMHGPLSDRVIEPCHVRRVNARVAAFPQRHRAGEG